MRIESKMGRIPTKRVYVVEVEATDTNDDILDFAMKATGETRSSLFGWNVDRFDHSGCASVQLYTD